MTSPDSAIHNAPHVLIEVQCPTCSWYALLPPGTEGPCERSTRVCPEIVSTEKHATLEWHKQGFGRRVAALLRRIEWDAGKSGSCPDCCHNAVPHHPDCALAALLLEAEA